MSYKVGICDSDTGYMVKFMEYINFQDEIPIRVSAFSSQASLEGYADSEGFDLIVLGDGMEIDADRILKLRISDIRTSENEDTIYKYQDIGVIAGEIIMRIRQSNNVSCIGSNKLLYGVYSPVGRCGKTRLAMGICEFHKPSLYIGLEEYCGVSQAVLGEQCRLGERFLYYVANQNDEISDWLKELSCERDGVCAVAGCRSYMDIRQLNEENMLWLRQQILNHMPYSRVVFDIGAGALNDIRLLNIMDRIFVPMLNDEAAMIKLGIFKEIIKEEVYGDLEKKLVYLYVPDAPYDSEQMREVIEGSGM